MFAVVFWISVVSVCWILFILRIDNACNVSCFGGAAVQHKRLCIFENTTWTHTLILCTWFHTIATLRVISTQSVPLNVFRLWEKRLDTVYFSFVRSVFLSWSFRANLDRASTNSRFFYSRPPSSVSTFVLNLHKRSCRTRYMVLSFSVLAGYLIDFVWFSMRMCCVLSDFVGCLSDFVLDCCCITFGFVWTFIGFLFGLCWILVELLLDVCWILLHIW